MARLSLFFSLLFVAVMIAITPSLSGAVSLHGIYTASCTREIGIILNVGSRHVSLLNLNGDIVDIERFEVIYYATFPIDIAPMRSVKSPEKVPLVEIETFQKGKMVPLVRGWPVDFNKDRISFLDLRGSEVVIDRSSIWRIRYINENRNVEFDGRMPVNREFAHPYAFSSCPVTSTGAGKAVRVFPQQLLSDPVAIKREFDRLQSGHKEVRRYESDQQFYAVPEIYKIETSLGMWLFAGSRYGASNHRENNFTPYLVDQHSSGPFGFQSEFRTGSGPLMQSIHEEPQTQIYYRMKADYFHFSAMADPSLLLVGKKSKWSKADLDPVDMRAYETANLEFGFDYGRVSFELHLGGSTEIGTRVHERFRRAAFALPRLGIRYQANTWIFNVMAGSDSSSGFDMDFMRANFEWQSVPIRKFAVSLIKRSQEFSGDDNDTNLPFTSEAESLTGAVYGHWRVKSRYWIGTQLALEQTKVSGASSAGSDSSDIVEPKAGVMGSLSF